MVHSRAIAIWFIPVLTVFGREPLTRIADVRALTVDEAAAGVPVAVQGTVVALEPSFPSHFFLHDGSAGCFIKTHPGGRPANLTPGDLVRVEGISDPLGYYPSVKDGMVKVLGHGGLPTPVAPGAGEMFFPGLDSEWVEVPAVVTGYESGDGRLTLAVEAYGLPFKAELPLTDDAEARAAALMQRPVRLRGIMGTIYNRQRQMTDRHFFVSSFGSIIPTQPQAEGDGSPLLTVAQLLTGSRGPATLVRLRGTVTQQDPKGFYLRDASGSTRVHAAVADPVPSGTLVEVEGYGAVAPFRPVLRATHVTYPGTTMEVRPVPFDPDGNEQSAMHWEWVTLDADFLGRRDGPIDGILQFRSGGRFFEALLPNKTRGGGATPARALAVGDRLRLTGICELTTTHALPRLIWVDGFRIHLPESGGLEILSRAPWWNPRRLFVALGMASSLALLGMAWTWILRRQVKRQMAVISHKLRSEAVGEERDRMARELHDTLEQQLSGVALQLDSLDHAVRQNPTEAMSTLSLARRMLRYTRLEARRSVWDLRSEVLEKQGLVAALQVIADTGGGARGGVIEVTVCGAGRALSAGVDFHLLRIAQEAVTNAIKHSGARTIGITLEYLPEETRLTIRDDGCGFDPSASQNGPDPHFGLLGMRERASKTGARLAIESMPGNGCAVTVTVPNTPHSAIP